MSCDIFPLLFLPECRMQRIIAHWTAGRYKASHTDKEHYHFIIEGDGMVVTGHHSIADNFNTIGPYAAHTLACNSGSIGVAMACMKGAIETPYDPGLYPMTENQWQVMILLIAQLCKKYVIQVTPQTILSHAEVEGNLGIAQKGKWDFTRLPFDPALRGAQSCGNKLRQDVQNRLKKYRRKRKKRRLFHKTVC